jgi:hypothetical protein
VTPTEWLAAKARSYHQDARRLERGGDIAGLTGEQWAAVYYAVSAELNKCAKEVV